MPLVPAARRFSRCLQLVFYVSFFLVALLLWCEVLIYYSHLALTCRWPESEAINSTSNGTLNALVLSDTHLLGNLRGHWFDKLRREWQMYRSFQSALTLFSPNVVFILGDIFDEGQWASMRDFDDYVSRFKTIFSVPPDCQLYVVTGNHDIGFHFRTNRFLYERFDRAMNTSAVDHLRLQNDVHIVRLNSMAMEKDGCALCRKAVLEIDKLSKHFGDLRRNGGDSQAVYPILLTHFPMFRLNESVCAEEDSAPLAEKMITHRKGIDCLSKESTDYLLDRLKPRLILNGHVHHSCRVNHTIKIESGKALRTVTIPEWTVASFSWRNKADPSFLLVRLTNSSHVIRKCFLPNENFVIFTYVFALAALLLMLVLMILPFSLIKSKDD